MSQQQQLFTFDLATAEWLMDMARRVEAMLPPNPAAASSPHIHHPLGFYVVATADLGGRKWAGTELVLSAATGVFTEAPPYVARTWTAQVPIIVPGPKPKVGDLLRVEMVGGGAGKLPAFVGTALQEVILDNMLNPAAATKLIRRRHTPASYVDDTLFEFPQCPT